MAPNIRRIVTILWLTWVTGIANAQEVAKIESLGAEEFRSELRQLSEECHAAGNQQLADVVDSWFVPLPMGRQLVFAAEPGVQVADSELASRFMALRRQRAAALWQDAQSAAGAGEIERAYQLVFATFRENPQHVDAARLAKDAIAEIKLAPGRAKHKRLPWKAGDYWRATTTHFSISTNASQKDLRNVAQTLEQYHQLWRQVFVRHWSTIHAVRQALAGRALSPPTRRKHHVVVFKNRKDFIRFLKPLEPQIEIALGVYRNKDRTTYLYLGDEDLRQTWIHETTHQLFQETTSARHEVGADAHFWVVEGIAIYMESARWHNGYFTLGGFESPRLQIARYRRLNERFYVPLESLAQFGREELQRHPEIRRLYTQSAGLAHFFMDGQDASYREDFVRLISDLYRKSKRIQPLSARTEVASHRLDDQYLRFLDVTDSDLENLPDVEKVENLALGHTQVTNRGLSSLAGADKVTWLDVAQLVRASDCGSESRGFESPQPPLKRPFILQRGWCRCQLRQRYPRLWRRFCGPPKIHGALQKSGDRCVTT